MSYQLRPARVRSIPGIVHEFIFNNPGCCKKDILYAVSKHFKMGPWDKQGIVWRSRQVEASLTHPDLINLGTERCHSWFHSDFFAKVC